VRSALESGAHVYIEKPFAWDETRPSAEWLATSRGLVDLADARSLFIGVNAQYVCAWDTYVDLVGRSAVQAARSFLVDIETSTLGPERQGERIWIDVGSHPISLLRCAMPEGRVREASVDLRVQETETVARFEHADPAGRVVDVTLRCARVESAPRRRFGVDDAIAEHSVASGPDGIVRALLSRGATERVSIDPMHDSIRRFLRAIARGSAELIACSGRDGVRDLELQVRLAALARQGRS
jgi:predicted dehydrogenase